MHGLTYLCRLAPSVAAVMVGAWSPAVAQSDPYSRNTANQQRNERDAVGSVTPTQGREPFVATEERWNLPFGRVRVDAAGRRQETRNTALNADPLRRLANRLPNRIRNRLQTRIERSNDYSSDPATALERAEQGEQRARRISPR